MSTATEPTLLDDLRDKRAEADAELEKLKEARLEAIEAFEARLDSDEKPTDEEREAFRNSGPEFRTACEAIEETLSGLSERISLNQEKEQREKAAADAQKGTARVTSEPATYRRDNAREVSYLKDLLSRHTICRQEIRHDWEAAKDRLDRHAAEMEDLLPKRQKESERKAEEQMETAEREFRADFDRGAKRLLLPAAVRERMGLRGDLEYNPFERPTYSEQRANPSRTPGLGGEFVPPLWLIEDFIPFLRAGRTVAPLCRNMELPAGTDTIKLPKIKTASEVAPQLADNAGVASKDIETEFVEGAVKTLAGQEDVAIQLIEQSPGQIFDRVVMEDLIADYNLKVDQNVTWSAGTEYTNLAGGTIKGLYPKANWGATELTSTNAEGEKGVAGVYFAAMKAAWSNIAKKRFSTEGIEHVMHPRRTAFIAACMDGAESKSGRPIINSTDIPNFNTMGLTNAETPAEGFAWKTPFGPGVYHTANIHTEDSGAGVKKAGETHDWLLSAKFDDVWFFESDLRTRVLPEILSGTLQIRFQVYAYLTTIVRYGPSICIVTGKPFVEPELFGWKF